MVPAALGQVEGKAVMPAAQTMDRLLPRHRPAGYSGFFQNDAGAVENVTADIVRRGCTSLSLKGQAK